MQDRSDSDGTGAAASPLRQEAEMEEKARKLGWTAAEIDELRQTYGPALRANEAAAGANRTSPAAKESQE